MPDTTPLDPASINPADFDVRSLDDELRVDELCVRLLAAVRDHLVLHRECTQLAAGEFCRGADFFLRDFIIAECPDNLFRIPAERIRQFAGHWYIVRTLEPDADQLAAILAGVAACYSVFAKWHLVAPELAEGIAALCHELAWYRQRIDEFWGIEGDGFDRWRNVCPLPPPRH